MCSAECWNHTGFQKTDQARSRDTNDSAESSAIPTEKRHDRSIEYWHTTGRYPVPLKFEDASHGEVFEDGKEYHVAYISGEDAEKANDLVIRLARHLYTDWRSTNLCNWIEELEGVQATPQVR